MNDLPEAIERLEKRLEALEQRVGALEHPLAVHWPRPSPELEQTIAPKAASAMPLAPAGSMFSVLGRAMLGIAGAYVLRAVEEASSVPKLAVASAGIAYAFLWLVWATRARGGPRLASTVYASTSALILAPMVWELSLRFNVLPAPLSAIVVCGYGLAAVGLAWKRDLKPVLRVACVAATGLALALAIASHAILPFAVVLLVLAAACEFIPGIDRVPEVRALVALAADAAIWILIYVYFAPQPAREDYPVLSRTALLAPGVAIFVLFAASVIVMTVLRARAITVFETVQATIAFLLAAVSVADFGPPGSAIILGIACLPLSAACYAAVFMRFERAEERRNAAVFTAWGAALLLAGSYLCLPPLAMTVLLSAAAIAATICGQPERPAGFRVLRNGFSGGRDGGIGIVQLSHQRVDRYATGRAGNGHLAGCSVGGPLLCGFEARQGRGLEGADASPCRRRAGGQRRGGVAGRGAHRPRGIARAAWRASPGVYPNADAVHRGFGACLWRSAVAPRGADAAELRSAGAGRAEARHRGSAPRPPGVHCRFNLSCRAHIDCGAPRGEGEAEGVTNRQCESPSSP